MIHHVTGQRRKVADLVWCEKAMDLSSAPVELPAKRENNRHMLYCYSEDPDGTETVRKKLTSLLEVPLLVEPPLKC